jgi:hypothetical protein
MSPPRPPAVLRAVPMPFALLRRHAMPRSCADVDVFLSNGVKADPLAPAPAPSATLYELKKKNDQASTAAAGPGGPVLIVDVYDADGDCKLRGTDNMQMRFASGLPHASICAQGNVPVAPSRFTMRLWPIQLELLIRLGIANSPIVQERCRIGMPARLHGLEVGRVRRVAHGESPAATTAHPPASDASAC